MKSAKRNSMSEASPRKRRPRFFRVRFFGLEWTLTVQAIVPRKKPGRKPKAKIPAQQGTPLPLPPFVE